MKQAGRKTRAQKMAASKAIKKSPPVRDSFESPESSNIARASYGGQELTITFRPKAEGERLRCYSYRNVPEALWKEFKAEALSKGKFFAICIRPYYPGVLCD